MKMPHAILSHRSSTSLLLTLFVGSVAFVLLLLPLRFIGTHDMDAMRLVPLSLLRDGDIDLREFAPFVAYVVEEVNGRLLPIHPIAPALLALPIYSSVEFFGELNTTRDVLILTKVLAAFTIWAALVFLWFTFRRWIQSLKAVTLSFLVGFGTLLWPVAAQDFRDHTVIVFLLAVTLFIMMRRSLTAREVAGAAFLLGLLVTVRLTTVVIAFPLFVALFFAARPHMRFMLTAFFPLAALALYNTVFFGSPFSHGYETSFAIMRSFDLPWWYPVVNAATLLVNPSKGLFIYSPFFLFSIVGAWMSWRQRIVTVETIVLRAASVAVFATLAVYSFVNVTHGGTGFGSRYLIDIIPLLAVLLIPVVQKFRSVQWSVAWIVFGAWAILVQFAGVLFFDESWHAQYDPGFVNPTSFRPSWVWDARIPPEPLYYLHKF
ncbi:MAG: hypothetical protein HYV34_03150 [Candidatus Kerfeldbacteria bacterium]|nr:hypothetical protein [Candidatus Kerfeldbacteria bacterium]